MKTIVIIVAGGKGSRMSSDLPKQFIEIINKPIIIRTMQKFIDSFQSLDFIVVFPESYMEYGKTLIENANLHCNYTIICGGATRFQSVKNAVNNLPNTQDAIVLIHDAVRCLVSIELIKKCYHEAIQFGNAIPAIMPNSSIRYQDHDHVRPLNREKLFLIQTPQTFNIQQLKMAFNQDEQPNFTDDATVVESFGLPIHIIIGDEQNLKNYYAFRFKDC